MAHIEIRDVTLVYDTPGGKVPGVKDVNFDIGESEFICIVGPSGCGKSTLLNMIAGFLAPPRGEIRIGGKTVTGHGMDRGVVFQDFAQLFPWRTALGNVAFGLEMKGVPKQERENDRARAIAPGETGEVHRLLPASSVRRHAATGGDCPRARLQSGGAADGRAVRGARRADPRRHAAAARRRVAGNAQDGDLRDAQCRRSRLSRRPRGGDDAASGHGEGRDQNRPAAAARSVERRISRHAEGTVAASRPRRGRGRTTRKAANGKSMGGSQ